MFVITSMPVGGAETLLINLMRRMDPNLVRPEVICLKEPGPLGEQIADEFPVHSRLLSNKWDLRVLPRLAKLIHQRCADVVITVGAGDKMFWGRIAAHLAGTPVIASALHSTGWPDGVGRANRTLTRITDAFIAVAESHGRFLSEFERIPREKVHVIRKGVDCHRFRPDVDAPQSVKEELGIPLQAPMIGLLAALRTEKNHSMLIQVSAKLADRFPEAHWLIVGDGPERPDIESLIRRLGVGERVHLLGTRHDTPRLLASLDVFALCSISEASPVSILEALACGVPVVATDVGSIRESIVPGKTGNLVPSRDVDQFADAIAEMLLEPSRAAAMGVAGRKRVQCNGSLESMVDGYQRLMTRMYDARADRQITSGKQVPSSAQVPSSEIASRLLMGKSTPLRKESMPE